MKRGEFSDKRGQVTIFIIIAIIIVSLVLLIYSFYPQIKSTLTGQEKNPSEYIQTCIEEDISDAVDTLSLQGGSISPENTVLYNNSNIEYLCYTTEYYRNCMIQQPLLKRHIETEIKEEISDEVDACFSAMKESYEKKGYTVKLKSGDKKVQLLPNRIISTFNYSLSLTKGESVEDYDSFNVILNNNLYELVAIAGSIINWEATYGDADVTTYMTYYPELKAEKKLISSGNKVYVITERETGNRFQFASRSQVWPAGYPTSLII